MALRAIDRCPPGLSQRAIQQEKGLRPWFGRLVKLNVDIDNPVGTSLPLRISRQNNPGVLFLIDRVHLHNFALALGDDDIPY